MARQKLKSLLTSFTPGGEYFAVLSPVGVVRIWGVSDESLLSEWSPLDADTDATFSCMACSFIGKKRKKVLGTCLLVLGSDSGEILAFDVSTGERKWKSTGFLAGGIAGLSFTNRGHVIRTVGGDGMASEISSETGEVLKEFKVSKPRITSLAFCIDEQTLAIASGKVRIFNLESGKEVLKFSADGGPVQHIFVSEDSKVIITSGCGEKYLQVWKSDLSTGVVSKGPILPMRHPPFALNCKSSCNVEESLVVLSVSRTGVAYVWNLKFSSEEISPIKVTVQGSKAGVDLQNGGSAKKNRISIIGARLQASDSSGEVTALFAYGSVDSMHFSLVDISNPSGDIVITAEYETKSTDSETIREDRVTAGKELPTGLDEEDLEAAFVPIENRKACKKRAASDPDLADTEKFANTGHKEQMNESQIDDGINEPTMGEKLESLNLKDNNETRSIENEESSQHAKPPSANSVHVLLKQALHADDQTLLLNCLGTQDEKVIMNSVSLLSISDVLKLLDSLIFIIHSRGAVLARALPWLRNLLLQHSSGIMSQESSLLALNSLYQLIGSRVSTFVPALQLSSSLDLLYVGNVDDGFDENGTITPVIFEDRDESEEEEEEAMETDQEAMEMDQRDDDHKPFDDGSDIDDMNFD